MSKECNHWGGDTVNGYWLCASCYIKLSERPYKTYSGIREGGCPSRQEIVFAPIAEHKGVTLSDFITKLASRLVAVTRGAMSTYDATEYAVDLLKSLGEKFSDPSMCWDTDGAWEIVNDDLQYWDNDESGSNS